MAIAYGYLLGNDLCAASHPLWRHTVGARRTC